MRAASAFLLCRSIRPLAAATKSAANRAFGGSLVSREHGQRSENRARASRRQPFYPAQSLLSRFTSSQIWPRTLALVGLPLATGDLASAALFRIRGIVPKSTVGLFYARIRR